MTYLRIAWLGTTPLLVMLATTAVLRGLQDTRTPLVVAVLGNGVNVVLNLVLVYGVAGFDGLGHRGSAIGTVLAQPLSAAALPSWWWRRRRFRRLPAPDLPGIRSAPAGLALVDRTVTLRASLLVYDGRGHGGRLQLDRAGPPSPRTRSRSRVGASWRSCSTRSRSRRRRSPAATSAPATWLAPVR